MAVIIDQQNSRVPINTLVDLSAAQGTAMMFDSDPLTERFKSKFGWIPVDTKASRGQILDTTDVESLMSKHSNAKALIIPKIDAERLAENNCDVVITQNVIKSGGDSSLRMTIAESIIIGFLMLYCCNSKRKVIWRLFIKNISPKPAWQRPMLHPRSSLE